MLKNNDSSIFNNIGVSYFRKGDFEKSIEFYDEAIKISPNDPLPLNNKGASLKNLKKYSEALECFNKAIEVDPNEPVSYYNKANTYTIGDTWVSFPMVMSSTTSNNIGRTGDASGNSGKFYRLGWLTK